MRTLCFLLAVSIFAISCDPNGDLMVNRTIDNQTEQMLEKYSSFMSAEDCRNFKETVDEVKAYVWQKRSSGVSPTQTELSNFVYDLHVRKGIIKNDREEREALAQIATSNTLMGDSKKVITNLSETKTISGTMTQLLLDFQGEFAGVRSYDDAFSTINQFRASELIAALSTEEKAAFENAMNTAENGVCYEMESEGDLESRDLCEECIWELNWVKVIIAVVVTVVVWLLAVITFGLSTLVSSIISIAVWAAVWVLHCFWVECESSGPCPDGQEPFCEGQFEVNLEDGTCELPSIYTGVVVSSSNCVWVDFLANGTCPGASMNVGNSQCLLQCFPDGLPDGFAQNSNGDFIFPFECQ